MTSSSGGTGRAATVSTRFRGFLSRSALTIFWKRFRTATLITVPRDATRLVLLDLPLLYARRPLRLQRQLESEAIGRHWAEAHVVVPISLHGVGSAGIHRLPGLAIPVKDSPGRRHPDLPMIPVVEEVHVRLRHRRAPGESVFDPFGRALAGPPVEIGRWVVRRVRLLAVIDGRGARTRWRRGYRVVAAGDGYGAGHRERRPGRGPGRCVRLGQPDQHLAAP